MRLFIVEDEVKGAEFVARGLRDELYEVDIAHDGETAWRMVSTTDYDLVVSRSHVAEIYVLDLSWERMINRTS